MLDRLFCTRLPSVVVGLAGLVVVVASCVVALLVLEVLPVVFTHRVDPSRVPAPQTVLVSARTRCD